MAAHTEVPQPALPLKQEPQQYSESVVVDEILDCIKSLKQTIEQNKQSLRR